MNQNKEKVTLGSKIIKENKEANSPGDSDPCKYLKATDSGREVKILRSPEVR